jgi:hypothetical protein
MSKLVCSTYKKRSALSRGIRGPKREKSLDPARVDKGVYAAF